LSSIDHLIAVYEETAPVVFYNCDMVHLQAVVALLPSQGEVFCWVGEIVVKGPNDLGPNKRAALANLAQVVKLF